MVAHAYTHIQYKHTHIHTKHTTTHNNTEYGYYYEANKALLPRVLDPAPGDGGLANRAYFNFVSYVGWKAAARFLPAGAPAARSRGCARAGALLLPAVAPGAAEALRARAESSGGGNGGGGGGVASEADVLNAVAAFLERLKAVGYVCAWQLVWGEQPGGWPADWYASQPGVVGESIGGGGGGSGSGSEGVGGGGNGGANGGGGASSVAFQVKLLQPADIRASVALRSEGAPLP